jgi:hypothetical protein|tara:strand:+ start:1099 stop:1884 length:786 start_codon:yes stop_codon:yes gene_type:complete
MQTLKELSNKFRPQKSESISIEIYERFFNKKRNDNLKLFEIGIGGLDDPNTGGNSLKIWEEYFTNALIYGLDLYKKNIENTDRLKIYQGSQVDKKILDLIHKDSGDFDFIIDDGSHMNNHQIKSFELLFKKLKDGGLYFIEDIQTSYYLGYGGDAFYLNNKKTAINYFKTLIDKINYKDHENPFFKEDYYCSNITEIHFFRNLIVIQKGSNQIESNMLINNIRPTKGKNIILIRKYIKFLKYFFHYLRGHFYKLIDLLKIF